MTVLIRTGAVNTDAINVLHTNIFDTAAITYSTQSTGYNAANITDDATWNGWKPTSVAAWVKADYGSAVTCDMLGISSHDMFTVGASFSLEYSTNNSTWTTASASYTPTSNEDIIVCFQSASARYWRINITGAIAFIGVAKLSAKLAFNNAPVDGHVALHHARKYEMLSNESVAGQYLNNRVARIGAETSVNVGSVDRDWAETTLSEFETNYNTGRTFFYCGSPLSTPKDMGYCKRPSGSGEMAITWVEGEVLSDVSFGVASYVPV
jgi:hypothetical protein